MQIYLGDMLGLMCCGPIELLSCHNTVLSGGLAWNLLLMARTPPRVRGAALGWCFSNMPGNGKDESLGRAGFHRIKLAHSDKAALTFARRRCKKLSLVTGTSMSKR